MSKAVCSVPEPWLVHEHPERPLAFGASFCGCETCRAVLEATGRHHPDLPLGVKFGLAARCVVDAGVLTADGCTERDLVRRFGDHGDWIRELWVARGPDDAMSAGEAWLAGILSDAGLPQPEWNVELMDDGSMRPAPVRHIPRTS